MSHDWRALLFAQMRRKAEEAGIPVRFPLAIFGELEKPIDVDLVDDKLRVLVTPELLAQVNGMDEAQILRRLGEFHGRRWTSARAALRVNEGKTVQANRYGTVRQPALHQGRKSSAHNVYGGTVRVKDLAPFLTPEQVRQVTEAELKRGPLALNELGWLIFPPPEGEAAVSGDETDDDDSGAVKGAEPIDPTATVWEHHRNVIFFGPPGTGKSYLVRKIVDQHLRVQAERVLRVTFHPETSYFDFVGAWRPTVGWVTSQGVFRDADEVEGNREPRTYYRFEPGPFSRALRLAAQDPARPVVLVIEEINRGNVAAIFGDVFQLLDRARSGTARDGWSEYPIQPSSEWATWLRKECKGPWDGHAVSLPPNLYLYATMNTSDQSLFPMDTAFRRRWGMEFVGVGDGGDPAIRVPLHGHDALGVSWLKLMQDINRRIVDHTGNDDRQMGPFFVRVRKDRELVDAVEFQAKVLFYLWSEVFRASPQEVFAPDLSTFEALVLRFRAGKPVFNESVLEALGTAP